MTFSFNASPAAEILAANDFPVDAKPCVSSEVIRVLLLEDNPGDALLIEVMLGDSGSVFQITTTSLLKTALKHLAQAEFELILSDLGLPDATSLDAARCLRAAAPATPLIVMTGNGDEETARAALKYGAQDFLVKGKFDANSLARTIEFAMTRHRTLLATERNRAQEQQLKEEFFSNVSHELRSPLTAISSFASILEDEVAGKLNGEQHQYIRIIAKNANQLNSMVDDLLEVTRAQAGKLNVEAQCVLLQEVVQDVVDSHFPDAGQKGIRLVPEIQSDVPPAFADTTRVRQILENLVNNAIKFTETGGEIHICLYRCQTEPSTLMLEVADTGCGISIEAQAKIFERLHQELHQDTAGRKGLGLGLYICREIVARLAGKIWVESAPGKGSRFFVSLPEYSLYKIISPPILNYREKADSLAVVNIRIASLGALSLSAELSHEVRQMLERCIFPNLDVLLPRINSAKAQDLFLILAIANEAGIRIMLDRIEDQLQQLDAIKHGKITFSVNYKMLEREVIRRFTAKEDLARWAAEEMRQLLVQSYGS
jgi:signal transduction histidine kinase